MEDRIIMITTIELNSGNRLKIEPRFTNPFAAFYIQVVDKDGKKIADGSIGKEEAKLISKLLS